MNCEDHKTLTKQKEATEEKCIKLKSLTQSQMLKGLHVDDTQEIENLKEKLESSEGKCK